MRVGELKNYSKEGVIRGYINFYKGFNYAFKY